MKTIVLWQVIAIINAATIIKYADDKPVKASCVILIVLALIGITAELIL